MNKIATGKVWSLTTLMRWQSISWESKTGQVGRELMVCTDCSWYRKTDEKRVHFVHVRKHPSSLINLDDMCSHDTDPSVLSLVCAGCRLQIRTLHSRPPGTWTYQSTCLRVTCTIGGRLRAPSGKVLGIVSIVVWIYTMSGICQTASMSH